MKAHLKDEKLAPVAAFKHLKISEQAEDMSAWLIKGEADRGESETRMSILKAFKQSMATMEASVGNPG